MSSDKEKALKFLKERFSPIPRLACVLGSGWNNVLSKAKILDEVSFEEIPGFKKSKVLGHESKLVLAEISQKKVLFQLGRIHYYERHSISDVVFSVRAMALSGVETFILTNASGGIKKDMKEGEILLIEDHLNFIFENPLRGFDFSNENFVDLTCAYDKDLLAIIEQVAKTMGICYRRGVYASMTGPSYETPAEIRMLDLLGASAVGMSTVSEVIALRQLKKKVAAISCIANLAAGVSKDLLSHQDVVSNIEKTKDNLSFLLEKVIEQVN